MHIYSLHCTKLFMWLSCGGRRGRRGYLLPHTLVPRHFRLGAICME